MSPTRYAIEWKWIEAGGCNGSLLTKAKVFEKQNKFENNKEAAKVKTKNRKRHPTAHQRIFALRLSMRCQAFWSLRINEILWAAKQMKWTQLEAIQQTPIAVGGSWNTNQWLTCPCCHGNWTMDAATRQIHSFHFVWLWKRSTCGPMMRSGKLSPRSSPSKLSTFFIERKGQQMPFSPTFYFLGQKKMDESLGCRALAAVRNWRPKKVAVLPLGKYSIFFFTL